MVSWLGRRCCDDPLPFPGPTVNRLRAQAAGERRLSPMPLDPSKIRTRREKLGLTQQQAAERAGLVQPNWAAIEAGKRLDPSLSTAERVAKALNCKLPHLLGDPTP